VSTIDEARERGLLPKEVDRCIARNGSLRMVNSNREQNLVRAITALAAKLLELDDEAKRLVRAGNGLIKSIEQAEAELDAEKARADEAGGKGEHK
jgi:hypothetical protein